MIRSLIVYGSRENFRIVTVGPRRASGGMIALTRLPSGRRASTIGDDSSTRRPTCETILSMIRITCGSSTKRMSVSSSLPFRSTYTLSGALTMISVTLVVAQQRLDRAVAEDVVRQLTDDLAPLVPRQRRAVEDELLGDRAVDLVGEILAVRLVELGPELRDTRVVDLGLQLRVRIDGERSRRARGRPPGARATTVPPSPWRWRRS